MNNIVHIFSIKQEEKLSDEIFQQFLLQIPELFTNEILKYKFWQGAQSSLLGKIILDFGFKFLNLNHSLHDIKVSVKERPFINNEIDFNISHSGNYIICAISTKAKVGIDIEKHRELKSNIADRYFDKDECNEIETSPNSSKSFFDLWSLKESAIKCDGRGVEVLSATHKQYQAENENTVVCDGVLFHYKQSEIEKNYSCCVCSSEKFEVESQQLNLSNLINSYL